MRRRALNSAMVKFQNMSNDRVNITYQLVLHLASGLGRPVPSFERHLLLGVLEQADVRRPPVRARDGSQLLA